jgi:hypothetical protein
MGDVKARGTGLDRAPGVGPGWSAARGAAKSFVTGRQRATLARAAQLHRFCEALRAQPTGERPVGDHGQLRPSDEQPVYQEPPATSDAQAQEVISCTARTPGR